MKKFILLLIVLAVSASFNLPVKKTVVMEEEKKPNLNLLLIHYPLAKSN